ncbi:MAG: DUF5678 domain-containing protein [Anaerolineae bacterium]
MTSEIREARVAYPFSIDETELTEHPLILERAGRPVAAVIPIDDYEQFVAWREREQTEAWQAEQQRILEREHAVFERLKPELLKTHAGQWVAIVDGELVDSDADEDALVQRVYVEYGYRTIFVEEVRETPHVYEFSSPEAVG